MVAAAKSSTTTQVTRRAVTRATLQHKARWEIKLRTPPSTQHLRCASPSNTAGADWLGKGRGGVRQEMSSPGSPRFTSFQCQPIALSTHVAVHGSCQPPGEVGGVRTLCPPLTFLLHWCLPQLLVWGHLDSHRYSL